MSVKRRILIADDREDIRLALNMLLNGRGYECRQAGTPGEVISEIARREFDLLLLDMNFTKDITSGKEGLDILASVKKIEPDLPVVVMTAFATVALAVETLRKGAADFCEKPWDNQRLLRIIAVQIELAGARARVRSLTDSAREAPQMTARSPQMKPVLTLVERVAPTDANILITGENGVGKNLITKYIHHQSNRKAQPMITVNSGALTEELFASELFGHVKGAFTDARSDRIGRFKAADGGTLFLDEIGNISPGMQAKLLRVIETGEFEAVGGSKTQKADVRLISATNADLPAMVESGAFREDLYYRLNTITIHLPPLRDRKQDILPLANQFLAAQGAKYGRNSLRFDETAVQLLQEHNWPGNIRELEHTILRAVLMAADDTISRQDLNLAPSARRSGFPFDESSLDAVEEHLIRQAVNRYGGNMKAAADHLGLGRSSLYRRLEKFNIPIDR